jgi:lipoprotein-anchoring transpeptidase ErfK/SrfK
MENMPATINARFGKEAQKPTPWHLAGRGGVALLVAAGLALHLSACAEADYADRPGKRTGIYPNPRPPGAAAAISFWEDFGVPGQPRIELKLGEQRAYFYKGSRLVGVSAVSTGREGLNTPTGKFHVIQKDKDHRSTLFGEFVDVSTGQVINPDVDTTKDRPPPGAKFVGAPMPNFLRVVNGVGMHAGYLPGVPASHGCIRLPLEMSNHFFANAPLGTPVEIKP